MAAIFVIPHPSEIEKGEHADRDREKEDRLDKGTGEDAARQQHDPHQPRVSPQTQETLHLIRT